MEEYILIDYLKGKLDPVEASKVEEWVSLSDEHRATLENLYVLMFVGDRVKAQSEIDVERAYEEFKQRLATLSRERKVKRIPTWRRVASVAAIIAVLFFSGTFGTLLLMERNVEPLRITTDLGERVQIKLPDGSNVWLNTYSSLEYKQSYFPRVRRVNLKGEAYFDVAHNRSLPFIVANNGSQIEVVGTQFNVRCNDDENFLSATLMEGAILFSNPASDSDIMLKPGQELLFDKETRQVQVKELTHPEDMVGWKEGRLIFENASLSEIAKTLERHYNVEIVFKDDKVKNERFNAEFETTDNIYQILSMLELTQKFKYEINKREIVISSK
ncbi:MAG: DUF4974 domain-containing protein [Bacteroidota bacterium]|nr:DUF4974 domain-containing protein [Bacteroidota bacterium]